VFLGRVVGPGEAQWLPEDTEAALTWQGVQDAKCSGCGHDRSESMAADSEDDWVAEAVKCHACATRDIAARRFAEQDGDAAGTYWGTERKGD
jgi:hypothetical protein